MTAKNDSHTPLFDDLKKIEELSGDVDKHLAIARDTLARRYPVAFVFLSTFGVVATYYGIEKLIEQTPWLSERPHVILAIGLMALFVSGTFMRKLR